MLNIKNEKVIDLQDWDELVQETYGRIYDLQQQDGCQERKRIHITIPDVAFDFENDSVPEIVNDPKMGVSFKAWLARDPNQPLDSPDEWDRKHGLSLWWNRNFYPELQTVANDLHARRLITEGDYVIDIDW